MADNENRQERALPSLDDLELSADMIGKAADVIDEMKRYNLNLQDVAAKGVNYYRAKLQEELKLRQELQRQVANLADEKVKLQEEIAQLAQQCASKDVELETLRDLLWPRKK